ncbi:MAG: hypothetical protein NC828_03055 [Candidatus Omnitrophica bacterium]|nr:hypothetical protein [Candidatus Omnitrophota bacterium]
MFGETKIEKDVYHVTEILNPPLIVYLRRTKNYYVSPHKFAFTLLGSGVHSVLEEAKSIINRAKKGDYTFEKENTFKAALSVLGKKVYLTGTPDLIIHSRGELWDFKVVKYYYEGLNLMRGLWNESKYPLQLNIYRAFSNPSEIKRLFIQMHLKDYNQKMMEKGIAPITVVEIPTWPVEQVTQEVMLRLNNIISMFDGKTFLPCSKDDTWGGLRCAYYCFVKDVCPIYEKK